MLGRLTFDQGYWIDVNFFFIEVRQIAMVDHVFDTGSCGPDEAAKAQVARVMGSRVRLPNPLPTCGPGSTFARLYFP